MSDGWRDPPSGALALPADDVHVWLVSLDRPAAELAHFHGILGVEERDRAARYRRAVDRRRFVARRGLLRHILSRYLDEDPMALRFAVGAHGKPTLERIDENVLAFNLSDSDGLAVYAITRHRALGIDLERVDPTASGEEIAERYFSRSEVEMLQALPRHVQPSAFFACWTRKEAYVKARGAGLSLPLDGFEVSVGPDGPPRLLSTALGPAETSRWRLTQLPLIPGYAAALCVEGHEWRLRCWGAPLGLPTTPSHPRSTWPVWARPSIVADDEKAMNDT